MSFWSIVPGAVLSVFNLESPKNRSNFRFMIFKDIGSTLSLLLFHFGYNIYTLFIFNIKNLDQLLSRTFPLSTESSPISLIKAN